VDASLWLGFAAAALAFVLGAFVLAMGRASRSSRVLAILLFAESLFQASFTASDLFIDASTTGGETFVGVGFVATYAVCAAYPWLLRQLDTPLVRVFRQRSTLLGYTGFVLALAATFSALFFPPTLRGVEVPDDSPILILGAVPAFLLMLALSALAFFASVSAFRRTEPGATRERARAFMIAFGARDLLFLVSITLNFASPLFGENEGAVLVASSSLNNLGTLVYVPLLAYGILKTQLFDIDVKVKIGISRSTVVTIVAVVSVVIGKIADRYAQAQWGWLAGIAAAVGMLFFTRGLNKVGDKVADVAMPQVQPTSAYLAAKKIEVYRAAVESALENDGAIDERERSMLDRLRAKLALTMDDCAAVEADVGVPAK
jgi:hypothetical protein